MLYNDDWIKVHSQKICPQLQKKISETYEYRKWVPAFLHKPLTKLRHRVSKQQVIIQLHPDQLPSVLSSGPQKTLGCKVEEQLDIVNGFSTKVSINALKKILSSDAVASIWHDQEVRALLDIASPTVETPSVWAHDIKGNDIGIAIIDTGIFPHPDLIFPKNRIIAFKDFIKKGSKPYDDNGHGTHCAGDAAGNGFKSKGKYRGSAPEANLIGVKVLDKKGSGNLSKVIAGIQWCMKNKAKYGIKVLSLSLGVKATRSYKEDPLCQAVKSAWDAGLVVCAAAGNEGPKPGTISSPGIEPSIITVGAVDDRDTKNRSDDQMADFSSRGPTIDGLTKPDLVAPGVNIQSLRAPRSFFDIYNRRAQVGRYYASMSGTSMATPICAGVAALILESAPNLTPEKVKRILMSSCRSVILYPNSQGAGLIDAGAAVGLARKSISSRQ